MTHAPFFFVEPTALDAAADGQSLVLTGDDARHLAVVRRAAVGDAISVSDGQGRVAQARLTSVAPASVLAVADAFEAIPAPAPPVTIYVGLPRAAKVDEALRDLVELGVDTIAVFEAGRSLARWDERRRGTAASRWATIARSAAKQSHRAWLPEVVGPLGLGEAASRAGRGGRGVIAVPGAEVRLADVLVDPAAGPVWAVVGPEGGLAPDEVSAFTVAGATPVGLGNQILRAETASVVVAALVLHQVGRLG